MRRSRLTSGLGQVVIDTMVGMDKDSSSDCAHIFLNLFTSNVLQMALTSLCKAFEVTFKNFQTN